MRYDQVKAPASLSVSDRSASASMTDELKTLPSPVWDLLDLTPNGREQWGPKLQY